MTDPGSNTRPAAIYVGKDLEAMSFARNYHAWILDEFAPYLGHTVAEVGAGRGDISMLLRARGVRNLFAFEPSPDMFAELEHRLSGWSEARAINDIFRAGSEIPSLDTVIYLNVLEHIENDLAELRGAWRALRPGGYLLIFVPALRWLYSEFDRSIGHYRRYQRAELERLVLEAGFQVIRNRYFDLAGVLPWYFTFVLLRRPMTAGSVSIYDRVVLPLTRLLERLMPPPIGKNLLLVARRPGP